jgi:superfamily II DNA or RNA helicase
MGRVMRPHPGKEFAVWLDHSGNYLRVREEWDDLYENGVSELDDGAEKTKPEPSDIEKEAAKCPVCHSLWPKFSDVCPSCGFVKPRRNDVIELPGELKELTGKKAEKYSSEVKQQWYRELIGYGKNKGYQDGWAYHKYQEKFGIAPPWKKEAADPGLEVLNWIKSRAIAFNKANGRR